MRSHGWFLVVSTFLLGCGSSPAHTPPAPAAAPASPASAPPGREDEPAVPLIDGIAVFLAADGDRVGLAEHRYFLARCGGARDGAALTELIERLLPVASAPEVRVYATDGTRYRDVVEVMDAIRAGGARQIAVGASVDTPASLTGPPPAAANPGCAGLVAVEIPAKRPAPPDEPSAERLTPPVTVPIALPPANPGAASPPPPPTILITITRDGGVLVGQHVVSHADAVVDGRIPALVDALLDRDVPADGQALVQADRNTAASVVTAVLESIRAAGYQRVALAVPAE